MTAQSKASDSSALPAASGTCQAGSGRTRGVREALGLNHGRGKEPTGRTGRGQRAANPRLCFPGIILSSCRRMPQGRRPGAGSVGASVRHR